MPCKLRLAGECIIKKKKGLFYMGFHPHFCPNPSFLDSSILMFMWTPSFPQLTSPGILISVATFPPQVLSYLVLGTFSVLSLIRRSEISVSGLDLLPYLKQESIIRELLSKLRVAIRLHEKRGRERTTRLPVVHLLLSILRV